MNASITSGLNLFFAASSPVGRQGLSQNLVTNARDDVARALRGTPNSSPLQAQQLSVKAPEGAALTTQFDYGTAEDGSTYIRGITIGAEPRVRSTQPQLEAPANNVPATFAPQVQAKPVSLGELGMVKTALSPAEQLAVFASNNAAGSAVNAAVSRESAVSKLYQQQSDLIYTANPLFDAAA